MRHLTRQPDARYRSRDKAAPASIVANSAFFSSWTLRAISFSCGKWLRIRRINPTPISASERQINDGQGDVELTRTLKQRNLISHHHNRLELCLKQAAYAFHQAKMPICQKRTTSLFWRHLLNSRSPPRGA
jgi:hypothetical protein